MPRTASPRGQRGTFHHGDLPGAAVAAAARLVAERGSPAFTLREVAAAVGVSHAAVYRHFPARLDLLAEVATRGFRALSAALRASVARRPDGSVDGPASLAAMGLAYVNFGRGDPGTFRVMTLAELCAGWDRRPDLAGAAAEAFSLLAGAVAAGQAEGSLRRDIPAAVAATSLWAAQHGYAMLAIDGQLAEGDAAHPGAPPGSLPALLAILAAGLSAGPGRA